jgi:putative salt-induced outer membrane protein YdiY
MIGEPVLKRAVCKTGLWATALCVIVAAVVVEADEVTLKKGDVLRGRITKATESSVTLVHNVFGELEVPKDQIASITVVHDVLGEITIGAEGIASFGLDKAEGEPAAEKKPPAEEKPAPNTEETKGAESEKQEQQVAPPVKQQTQNEEEQGAWFEPEFKNLNTLAARLKKTGWSAAFDFSLNTSTGNTDEETTRFGAHIKRRLPRERLHIDASYYYKESDGDTTDNKFTSGAIHDWLNPGSRWFFFALSRFDYDEFESWEKRSNAQVGPGYNLIGTDDMALNLRAGAGFRKEWGSENSDTKFEGLAGFDFVWKLTDRQSFDTTFHYYPVITDFDDYRTRATLDWRYLLSKEVNVSLVLGVRNEFQSVVDPGQDDTDTRVFMGIQMSFE